MTTNTKHEEQRHNRRVSIPEHPKIYDAHNGEAIGELVNLSSDGLMAASSECISCGSVRQMRIPLIKGEEQVNVLVGAESLWCEDANDSGIFWTGFQIIDISPEDQLTLDAIVGN
jgi:c-di-GMP-binding flagellar brake protein YcgR